MATLKIQGKRHPVKCHITSFGASKAGEQKEYSDFSVSLVSERTTPRGKHQEMDDRHTLMLSREEAAKIVEVFTCSLKEVSA